MVVQRSELNRFLKLNNWPDITWILTAQIKSPNPIISRFSIYIIDPGNTVQIPYLGLLKSDHTPVQGQTTQHEVSSYFSAVSSRKFRLRISRADFGKFLNKVSNNAAAVICHRYCDQLQIRIYCIFLSPKAIEKLSQVKFNFSEPIDGTDWWMLTTTH